jgi:hypothetical protein
MSDINPLNVLGKRIVESLPLHFTTIQINCNSWKTADSIKQIRFWAYTSLEGRFWVGESSEEYSYRGDNSITVAFEDSSEATYFSLAYPHDREDDTPF